MTDISPVIIKKTQDLLGKYVKKPPLTEKLLKKPPFRFLHDVIKVVIQDTNFLDGLYTPDELDSAKVKEKDAKIDFLQKLIDVVKLATNENIKAKPSKIVAGLEPDRTNELLQAIGRALDKKIDSKDAVTAFKSGDVTVPTSSDKAKPATKLKVETRKPITPTDKVIITKTKKTDEPVKPSINIKKSNDKVNKVPEKEKANGLVKNEKVKEIKNVKSKPATDASKPQIKNKKEIVTEKAKPKAEVRSEIITPVENSVNHNSHEDKSEKLNLMGEEITPIVEPTLEINETKELLNENSVVPIEQPEQIKHSESPPTPIQPAPPSIVPKLRSSYSAELVDIIDQEAEIRAKEKQEKKSRHKSRRKSNNEDELKNGEVTRNAETEVNGHISPGIKQQKSNEENGIIREKSFIIQQNRETPPNGRPRTSLRPPSVRPASARPGAPRRRDKNIEIVLQPDETVKMGIGPNIKVENFNEDLDDDGENLIIIEDPTVQQDQILNDMMKVKITDTINGDSSQQGHLVQQILKTQMELSKMDGSSEMEKKNETDWDTATIRHRQSSAKQMDTLRDSIQKLTRSVNPLGKLMDFLQEDIDSMQIELNVWRNVYKSTTTELKKEQGLTETAVEPLKHQLAQIEMSIKEHIELTNICRVNILQNEKKIFKLLNDI